MDKTRHCIICGNLSDTAGTNVCSRCQIPESEPPPKKSKILIIDDDPQITEGLKEAFENTLHFDVFLANDGEQGYQKVVYDEPDLIIVDVLMPKMNGRDFVAKVRDSIDERTSKLPILVISDKDMEHFFLTLDIQGYFQKPVNMKELFSTMKKSLEV